MKRIAPKGSSEAFLRAHLAWTSDECLTWPYRTVPAGYGLAVVGGVQKRASRWMCILAHGEPPSSKHEAAHKCGNAKCVNPKHLRWATPAQNSADKLVHGTHNRGERSGKTKLASTDVRAIREAPPDLKVLMARFGVSKGCISKIRSGQRWRYD
jgi:hypothetical protein